MSWIEGWFLLILVVELLTITQWVEDRGDVCWYWWNCWPSLNELKWEMIFVDIGEIVDHHSINLGERWFFFWWIFDHHSMNWGEMWFLLTLVELLTITQWVDVRGDFVDISGIVDHHSMSWSERWFLLILVELLTITQWVKVRGDFCWYWGIVDHHSMS